MSDRFFLVTGIVLFLAGCLCILALIMSRIRCRTIVTAAVSDLIEIKYKLRGSTIIEYRPVFTFLFNGEEYTVTADFSSRRRYRYEIGSMIRIHIDPGDPSRIYTGNELSVIIFGIAGLLAGSLLIYCYLL